jgi:hypothetical protein
MLKVCLSFPRKVLHCSIECKHSVAAIVSSLSVFAFDIGRLLSEISLNIRFPHWRKSVSIYVGNLSYEVTEDDVRGVFAEYGDVKRVFLPSDRETGRPRGFGFVEMQEELKEDEAISALDGAEWMGRQLRVNKAREREQNGRR